MAMGSYDSNHSAITAVDMGGGAVETEVSGETAIVIGAEPANEETANNVDDDV